MVTQKEANQMKTTDGYEVKINDCCYLANGEEVYINESAITDDGKAVFLVTPIFEGETMQASGDGGYHHEISIPYEHAGEETLVNAIFKHPPTKKLSEKYKSKLGEITALSVTILNLTKEKKELLRSYEQYKSFIDAENVRFEKIKLETQKANGDLDVLIEQIKEKKLAVSILEDSEASFINDSDLVSISKEELSKLNKISFKMQCLEAGGIDNWDWYDESLTDFRERYPE